MLKSLLVSQSSIDNSAPFPLYKHLESTHNLHIKSWFLNKRKLSFLSSRRQKKVIIGCVYSNCIKGVMASGSGNTKSHSVKAIVTLKQKGGGLLSGVVGGIQEVVGKTLVLELVSNELDPSKFNFFASSSIFSPIVDPLQNCYLPLALKSYFKK